jgi:adenylate cyclase
VADVFVSYARSDKARVAPLVAAIEAQGWSVWWDPAIVPGQEFDREIAAELKAAVAVLVVWTPKSVDSRWVRGEAREAADRGILVPVRFERATLPIDVRALHTTDLDDATLEARSPQVQELLRALGTLVDRQRAAMSATAGLRPASTAAGTASGRVAICVLPFANMSGDPEQEYFSDGITEDIITDLSKVSALAVTSRNSAFVYKGRHVDVPKVAREFGVSHVLEGSVRKSGSRVRITAQLIDGANNNHLWAERYDRDLNDIFSLQDEISEAIVKALRVKLQPEEKQALGQRGTDSVEAYNLYLMAWQHNVTGNELDVRRAETIVRLCKRATDIDPNYARAWALMGLAQMTMHFFGGRPDDTGLVATERALGLDDNLAEAHAVKGRILSADGHHDEASVEIDIALRLDPESYEVHRQAGKLRYRQHRFEEAIRHYVKAISLVETDIKSSSMLSSSYIATGNDAAAREAARTTLSRAERALAQDPNNAVAMGLGANALVVLDEIERAKEWMNRAVLIDPDDWNARYNFACTVSASRNDTDGALELLRPLFATMTMGHLIHARVDPDLDSLREDPRFKAMFAAAETRLGATVGGSAKPS